MWIKSQEFKDMQHNLGAMSKRLLTVELTVLNLEQKINAHCGPHYVMNGIEQELHDRIDAIRDYLRLKWGTKNIPDPCCLLQPIKYIEKRIAIKQKGA